MLTSRQFSEVLRRPRHDIVVQLEDNPASRLRVNSNVKLDNVGHSESWVTSKSAHEDVGPAVSQRSTVSTCTLHAVRFCAPTLIFRLLMRRLQSDVGMRPF